MAKALAGPGVSKDPLMVVSAGKDLPEVWLSGKCGFCGKGFSVSNRDKIAMAVSKSGMCEDCLNKSKYAKHNFMKCLTYSVACSACQSFVTFLPCDWTRTMEVQERRCSECHEWVGQRCEMVKLRKGIGEASVLDGVPQLLIPQLLTPPSKLPRPSGAVSIAEALRIAHDGDEDEDVNVDVDAVIARVQAREGSQPANPEPMSTLAVASLEGDVTLEVPATMTPQE